MKSLRRLIRVLALALAMMIPNGSFGVASAQEWSWQLPESNCQAFYADNQPPIVISEHDFGNLQEFCYGYFAVLHSTDTRGAIWSAMFLERRTSLRGDCINRQSFGFRVQRGVPRESRASSRDYAGHGDEYEIGHMTPANDMPTVAAQRETFVFSNAVPQASELNSPTWSALEAQIHNLAEDVPNGLYIVTGPIFAGETIGRLNRVGIPTHVFKAVYDPSANRAIAFIARNRHDATVQQISLAELESDYGVVAFPSLSDAVRGDGSEWELPDRGNRPCLR